MVQRLGLQPVEAFQPFGRVHRDRVAAPAFAEHLAVERVKPLPEPHVQVDVCEITVFSAAQIVRGPVLVREPDDLVRMAHEVGRELGANDDVDGLVVALGQIQEPPCRGVRQNLFLRIPFEWNGNQIGFISSGAQVVDQFSNQRLRPAAHEGHLGFAHENGSHSHLSHTERPHHPLIGGWPAATVMIHDSGPAAVRGPA